MFELLKEITQKKTAKYVTLQQTAVS